jgi:hypothetical protein
MAFTKRSENKWMFLQEDLAMSDPGGVAASYGYSSSITGKLGNRKFPVRGQVLVDGDEAADVALDIAIQGSLDGTNWVDLDASLGVDMDNTATDGTEIAMAVADLTNLYSPYYRVKVFSDGSADCGSGMIVRIQTAYEPLTPA